AGHSYSRLDTMRSNTHTFYFFHIKKMASEFAVSEVFSLKKSHIDSPDQAMPLQSSAQLKDHDDAYSEAQALLGDWLHSKLRLELELDEDDLIFPAEKSSPLAMEISTPTPPNYNNFDDMYNSLIKEEESSTIDNFLQELMEQEVLDSTMMDELAMDAGQTRKRFRNPALTMDARHKQVRENKARREAARQRQQREQETVQEAREQARRRERELEQQRRLEARRQEDMLQQEVVRLRRQMGERRCAQQLARQRYGFYGNHWPLYLKLHLCSLIRHFTGWFSVVLNQRIRMVWRAWRTLVWQKQQQREVERTELELRAENRCYLLAVQSDKRRLLQRCLNDWQVWSQMERQQRNLLSQQQETRRKMAALISAATSGKLRATQNPNCQAIQAPTEIATQSQTVANVASMTQPTEPWQITRQHVAPSGAEVQRALQKDSTSACLRNLQQIISQQRKLLKEQQGQIAQLTQQQHVMGLELEVQKTTQRIQLENASGTKARMHKSEPTEQRYSKEYHVLTLPLFEAMEARARQRAERRKEVEEIKKRKEERRTLRLSDICVVHCGTMQREEEKQRQLKRQQEQMTQARQHYHRTLLLRRGLAPWKRLVQLTHANMQLAQSHHNLSLLRLCTLRWQRAARESLSEKEASADQLHQHFLLRRSLGSWKRVSMHPLPKLQGNTFCTGFERVLQRWFLAWRQLPFLLRREREKEQRREKLVRKVAEVLPDFCFHPS
uniref:Coiled-coil domain containing 191 n=1 Tax=Neogobius melanostomus TaxID=47308 RepID=A0A8C6TC29_9GOBI